MPTPKHAARTIAHPPRTASLGPVPPQAGGQSARTGHPQSGLTLIEVLVAIAVLAGAVGAVIVLMATQARGAAALSDKALARIVAENAMVAVVIGEETGRSPDGTEEVAGRAFAWEAARTNAPLPGLEGLTVSVRREDGEQVLAGLTTLVPAQGPDE